MPAKKKKSPAKSKTTSRSAKTTSRSTKSKSAKSAKSTKSTKAKSATSRAKKPAAAKGAASSKATNTKQKDTAKQEKKKSPSEGVALDRRHSDRRSETAENQPAPILERRKKVQRRRQIDPTTCERDYSPAEVEFMGAMDDYKRKSGRMFPTCSEVLEVIGELGYVKLNAAELSARSTQEQEKEPVDAGDQAADENMASGWPVIETVDDQVAAVCEFAI